ncbi:LysR family transcriptional regulator [Nitratireductor indicus C115]|uniref:LysR family transcriptional regulator n=1 Tax=Nitratireductor indicus C115 TaxID=1231190 RepID=K2NTN4_9HYPH|nr:LysR family transcriptional regulator [Nitratireductor indicus]EKF42635.1 LysR family transcriptional regulator [Nitratireductor indicus C115]SFQ38024.1 regulatory helix-turn-helix protein, lysR family [Nitratireductor indicus]
MDIRQLKVIQTVCKTGSVTETARMLHVSQPAISKTVRQVEEETGLTLFENIQGRIFPTEQAHSLLPVQPALPT